mmetsp:Transcript_21654/g.73041  ORF Transcript_21654/g.73041 Transcript_21654/m.73041 type:complete len:494 (+) Transcript_21654:93-1574(+)
MGFTFGSPGHDARSVTVHIEKLSILGDPAAREVGGMEAWIEVEMPGLDHLLTTPRVQATAGDFVFACVLEAHIGLAAEAKLREALASRDEEDADVTFKLRALGPRKKAKEVASGYFNLHQTLKHGQDLSGQIQLDGRDDEPFGSLAVSLTVLEVLRLCQPSTDPSESPEVVADTTGDALEAAPNSSTMPLCDPRPAPSTLEAAPCANAGFATPGKDHIASKEGGAGVDISESEIIARARRLGINLDVAGVAATEPAVGFVGPAVAAAAAAPLNTTLSPAGGYTCDPESTAQLDEATEALLREMLSERREAQRARDYARADLLREKIRDLGVRVQDRTETYFVELCKSAGDGGETPSSSSHGYVRGDAGAVSFSEEEQLTIDRLLLERVRSPKLVVSHQLLFSPLSANPKRLSCSQRGCRVAGPSAAATRLCRRRPPQRRIGRTGGEHRRLGSHLHCRHCRRRQHACRWKTRVVYPHADATRAGARASSQRRND